MAKYWCGGSGVRDESGRGGGIGWVGNQRFDAPGFYEVSDPDVIEKLKLLEKSGLVRQVSDDVQIEELESEEVDTNSGMTKSQLIEECVARGIQIPPAQLRRKTNAELIELLQVGR